MNLFAVHNAGRQGNETSRRRARKVSSPLWMLCANPVEKPPRSLLSRLGGNLYIAASAMIKLLRLKKADSYCPYE